MFVFHSNDLVLRQVEGVLAVLFLVLVKDFIQTVHVDELQELIILFICFQGAHLQLDF